MYGSVTLESQLSSQKAAFSKKHTLLNKAFRNVVELLDSDHSNLESLIWKLSRLSDWKTALQDGMDLSLLPLGLETSLSPESSLAQVSEALKLVQLEIESQAKSVADQSLPTIQELCRAEGWRFDTSIRSSQPFRLDLLTLETVASTGTP